MSYRPGKMFGEKMQYPWTSEQLKEKFREDLIYINDQFKKQNICLQVAPGSARQ